MQAGEPIAWPYPFWIAHRGAGQFAPENTLAAFRLGASMGYGMFECDVQLSADGVVFLMHDSTLERTTNGQGVGGKWYWSALSQLDAGRWHSSPYASEPVPSLTQIAHFCLTHGHLLNIEIKPSPGTAAATGEAVAHLAAQLWHPAAVPPLLTSFEPAALAAAQQTASHLPRGLLVSALWDGWLDMALALDCVAVVARYPLWDATTVAQVHNAGLRCLSYTVNDEGAAQHLLALGINGIITDRLDLFRPNKSLRTVTR